MPLRLDEFERASANLSARRWRERLAAGDAMTGLWVVSSSATAAEILGASGADWIIIDAEHSPNTLPDIVAQLRALAASPALVVVRAGSKDPLELGRLLDAGVRGLMVPMVETASDAEAVVAATRYPPRGRRGVGGGFARATRWTGIADYLPRAEDSFSLIVQIESAAGIAALDEILAVDGIDGVFFGPADLAASLGKLGQPRHPDVQSTIEHAIRATVAAGGIAGVNAFDPDDALRYRAAGAQLLAVGADVTLLAAAGSDLVARVAAAANPDREERP
ncbi:HpcH/HpaI aldolase family protein [Microbacterium aurantiacum]|uniref:2-dehydro-3-deoxyglucarate aldolase n=1 Tax=Microbacterium aurantiacum TaxID=162393 RepID=A0ABT8FW85_9MICO|nr:aldolase/citrate lyase family protein [Microbacterium aurantiacum]MDN4465357.1 2-dehydro-3-deoxyglucarate aldolase [Microbacterium aurantiacum]